MVQWVKSPPAMQEMQADVSSIPRSGKSPSGGHSTHSSILAWRIPWTEKPGGLQSDYVSLVNFGASVVVQMVKNLPAMQETWV